MKNKLFIVLSLFGLIGVSSCQITIQPVYENTYVVIWQNDNGDILEIDCNLKEGTIPTYDGNIPTKKENKHYSYEFIGWTPKIEPVIENTQYTATYKKVEKGDTIIEDKPTIDESKKMLTYGYYPQTHVNDEKLINVLNTLKPSSKNGWYLYKEKYYAKEVASTFHEYKYYFDDKTEIINGNEYWFEVEPIKWNILSNSNNEYFLLSNKLLDTHNYYKNYETRDGDIYPNNYEFSDIRKYLNSDFYNTAFTFGDSYIKQTLVNNSSLTTDSIENKYSSNNTNDKIFLPSYKDYLNSDYGFDINSDSISSTREAKLSDYARAKGAWCNIENDKYTGSYWTRSPSSEFSYSAINVNSAGYLSSYAVDGETHAIRPSLKVEVQ